VTELTGFPTIAAGPLTSLLCTSTPMTVKSKGFRSSHCPYWSSSEKRCWPILSPNSVPFNKLRSVIASPRARLRQWH